MSGRDQNTTNLSAPYYRQTRQPSSNSIRMRRKRKKRMLIAVFVAAMVLLLTASLTVLIVQTVKNRADDPKPAPDGTTPVSPSPVKHGVEQAIDGNDATYFESDDPQTPGAYYLLTLETEADVMNIDVKSNHPSEYIRACDVQVSSDGSSWKTVGSYSGEPSSASTQRVSLGYSVRATYIRLILTEAAPDRFVLNRVAAFNNDGREISVRSGNYGITDIGGDATSEAALTTEYSDGYVRLTLDYSDLHKGDLILVGPSNPYVFPESTASILQIYENRTVFTDDSGKKVYSLQIGDVALTLLEARALKQLNAMCDAFYKETGITKLHVGTNSGYRSRETQAELAAKYTTAAQAGYSDHNTGLSVNIDVFDGGSVFELGNAQSADAVTALSWITLHAAEYGFVERFPPSKYSITGVKDDYHYRYVGYPHAFYMSQNGLVLEEYLSYLEKNAKFGENTLKFTTPDGRNYEIWFVPVAGETTKVPVPDGRPYTVSGNNYNGFIVTVAG
ncbi:MAG: D-alanyl-D-alanine carboxypeptidase family protein [Clostridia bacterium]|nr:D-alanyl-D-alanine carboxypeptidase family protein [Clostridia bacterium]